jgi:2-polyprenyl-3-methyl-5-hydroxy-6-metoxy-1,4-benzoquinol methylase
MQPKINSSRYDDRRLRLLADNVVGHRVLDIGFAQIPNPHLRSVHRTGLDLSMPNQSCALRYDEEVTGNALDAGKIFKDRKFDTIICGEIIEHVENPYELLRSLWPLLADNGRLLLSTPNPLAFPVVLVELIWSRRFFYTEEHLHYFLPRWVERFLNRTGFKLKKAVSVGIWTPFGALPVGPPTMSYQVIYVATKLRGNSEGWQYGQPHTPRA